MEAPHKNHEQIHSQPQIQPSSISHLTMHAKSLQLCPTICNLMDCSPPGSSVHGSLQTRILEWVAMSSSRGSSPPRDQTRTSSVSCIGTRVLYHEAEDLQLHYICRDPYTKPVLIQGLEWTYLLRAHHSLHYMSHGGPAR